MTIREQLSPRIRQAGIVATAKRAAIARSTLSEWLTEKRNRRLGDEQIDAILDALGLEFTLSGTEDPEC